MTPICLNTAELEPVALDHSKIRSLFLTGSQRLEDLDVDWLCLHALAAQSLDDVATLLRMVMEGVGATACVLCQVGHTRGESLFEIQINCPKELERLIKSRKLADDAVMVACEQRVLGFEWSDLERVIDMNDRRRETLALYAAYGLHNGYTVPLSIPGETRGLCSFGYSSADSLTFQRRSIMQITAPVLFETARRVQGLWREHRMPHGLSHRQAECVTLVAQGLSDAQIAGRMGIGIPTVHEYLEVAKKRYGAKKRVDLVVKAIRSGDVHWNKIAE